MTAFELEPEVGRIIHDRLHFRVPSNDTDLIESGALDSLTLVELLVELERTFRITIPLEDLDLADLRSVASIATLVAARVTRKTPRPAAGD